MKKRISEKSYIIIIPSSGARAEEKFYRGIALYIMVIKMAVGFVLISTAPGKEHEVYNALKNIPEIVELHPLFGEFDLIAKIETKDFNELGEIVVEKIRMIDGVIDTKTLTGIKF